MPRARFAHPRILAEKYPPSPACSCEVCLGYCARPGWWAVEEAARALEAGLGPRMMLEVPPKETFGVLSPAYQGCEGGLAYNLAARRGCTFLTGQRWGEQTGFWEWMRVLKGRRPAC